MNKVVIHNIKCSDHSPDIIITKHGDVIEISRAQQILTTCNISLEGEFTNEINEIRNSQFSALKRIMVEQVKKYNLTIADFSQHHTKCPGVNFPWEDIELDVFYRINGL